MAANVREVELALQVSTSNVEAIRNLQTDVAKLAKESGDAAPEFGKLASELDRLAKEAAGLDTLSKVAADVDKVAAAQAAAADRARELTAEYNKLKGETDKAAQAQAEAKTKYDQAKNATAELGDQIKQLKAGNTEVKVGTDQYTAALKDLINQQVQSRSSTRELKTAYDESKAATTAARTEQNALSNDYRNAVAQAGALTSKLQEQKAKFAEVAQATTGVSTAQVDLIGSGARLAQSLESVRTASTNVTAEVQRMAAAKKAAALEDERIADRAKAISLEQQAQAKAEADGLLRDYARMEAAQKQAATSAKTAADAMASAFGTVGAKSVKDLEAKILETRNAMQLLATSGKLTGPELKTAMAQGEAAVKGLEREIRAATGSLTLMDKATNVWNQSMGGMKVGTLLAAGAISSLFQKVTELGGAFLTAVTANERLVQSLNNIHKDGTLAASQIAFLRQSANAAGVSVTELQQSFVKYSAAMSGANIPLAQSNALFTALTKAGGSLGLSTDAVNRAMEALGQMASKGTVSMEELRQQLGDALPGALGMAAKGLGITEAQVIALVSSGQLAAKDFFPAFTTGLGSVSGEANTLSQNFERLKNNISAVFIAIGDAGVLDVLKGALWGVAETAKLVGSTFVVLTEGISNTIRMSAAAAGAIAGGGGLKGAWEAVNQVAAESKTRMEKLGQELYGTEKATNAATVSATANATALGQMGAATAGASKALLSLNIAIGEEADKLAHASKMAEEHVKSTDTNTAAALKAAKGIGDVAQAAEAEAEAHKTAITALGALATARTNELKLLQEQFAATKLLLEADGLLDKADQDRLLAMAQEIEKRAEVVKGITAKIDAQKQELAQSELEGQMAKDNSGRLSELIGRYNEATEAVKKLRAEKAAGKDVDAELTAATQKWADASKLAADAANDTAKAEQAKLVAIKASNAVTEASLQLQMNSAKSLESLATATGNTTLAIRAKVAQMEIEIKMSQAKAAALKAEADAEEAIARAKLKVMELSGKIDPVQKAELDGVTKLSEAKRIQAKAIEDSTSIIQREINALNTGTTALGNHAGAAGKAAAAQDKFGRDTSAATAALEQQNAALERNISAQEKANDLKERAIALENKRRGVDAQGFSTDPQGNRIVQSYDPIAAKAQKAARKINEFGNVDPEDYAKHYAYFKGQQDAELEKATNAGKASAGGPGYANIPSSTGSATTQPAAAGPAKTYNVTFNGSTVKTASDADAQKLMGMLKQAKGSA